MRVSELNSKGRRRMVSLIELYDSAVQEKIQIYWYPLSKAESLSLPSYGEDNGAIAINPWKMETKEKELVLLGHELGHCMKGAFYNKYAARDIRQKHENRADKWEIEHLIDPDELNEAMASGCNEIWSLAEHFGVTEDFMRKVVCWYVHGNLDVEHYMCS